MRRSHRLRVPAIAVVATAALAVAACSSSSSTSASPGAGTGAGTGAHTGPAAGASSSASAPLTASAPGITATTITIGSHQPLTGPAAPGYSEIAPAANAYFSYVNAHGGAYGRKIVYKYLDDAYDPTKTASVVHQLVLRFRWRVPEGYSMPVQQAPISKPRDGLPITFEPLRPS